MDSVIVTKNETDNSECSEKPTNSESCRHEYFQNVSLGTFHMGSYVIETVIQIFLIAESYRSFDSQVTENWFWVLFLSSFVSAFLVSITSIVWTFTRMDFSGTFCGKLVCILMHCSLLGLLWRFLKIALAYEKADAEEFFRLRTLQLYIQALPLAVIHLVYLVAPFQGGDENFCAWMVGAELLSVIICLASYSLSKPNVNLMCESNTHTHHHNKTPLKLELNATSRILLLTSRVLAIVLLVSLTSYWSMLVIVVHLVICQTWLSLFISVDGNSNNIADSNSPSKKNKWAQAIIISETKCSQSNVKNDYYYNDAGVGEVNANTPVNVMICTYVLFWDVNSTIVGGMNLRSLSLPVLLVLVQNVAIVIFYLFCQTTTFLTVTCGISLVCGCMILGFVTTWNKWSILLIDSHNGNGTGSSNSSKDVFLNDTTSHNSSHTTINLGLLPVVDPNGNLNLDETTHRCKNNMTRTINNHSDFVVSSYNSVDVENCDRFRNKINAGRNISSCGGGGSKNGKYYNEGLQGTHSSTASTMILQPSVVTSDYERINETLMTTVNKVASSKQAGMQQEQFRSSSRAKKGKCDTEHCFGNKTSPGSENKLCGSTSSRNTNTMLDFSSNSQKNNETHHQSDFYLENESKVENIDMTKMKEKVEGIPHFQIQPHNTSGAGMSNESKETFEIHQKSPLQIRRASKVVLNHPRHHSTPEPNSLSRCFYLVENNENDKNNGYEKLIEDAYGILIYEGESTQRTERFIKHDSAHSTIFHPGKTYRVFCANCHQNHDPLLTGCTVEKNRGVQQRINRNHLPSELTIRSQKSTLLVEQQEKVPIHCTRAVSETTEYPSDTEFTTCNNVPEGDELSISTHMSTVQSVTYVNLPNQLQLFSHFLAKKIVPNTSREIPKEFTSTEYVKAWLMMNDDIARLQTLRCSNNYTNNNNNLSTSAGIKFNYKSNFCTQPRLGNKERLQIRVSSSTNPRPRSAQSKVEKNARGCYQNSHLHPTHMAFQPPPKQKQHPFSAFSVLHQNQNSHHQYHQHVHYNSTPDEYHLSHKMMHLQDDDDLLETIV